MSEDVKALIAETHRVEGLAGLVYYRGSELSKDEAKRILDFAITVRGALEAAQSAPRREAIANALHADECPDEECEGGDMSHYDRLADAVLALMDGSNES